SRRGRGGSGTVATRRGQQQDRDHRRGCTLHLPFVPGNAAPGSPTLTRGRWHSCVGDRRHAFVTPERRSRDTRPTKLGGTDGGDHGPVDGDRNDHTATDGRGARLRVVATGARRR